MKAIIKKYLLIFLGSLTLVLGLIGIFIPVLPTTPFLLLTSYCYLRSSRSLYKWLISHKILGRIIKNYIEYKTISKRTKISALLFLWISLTVSMLLISTIYTSILLTALGIGVSIYILSLKNS